MKCMDYTELQTKNDAELKELLATEQVKMHEAKMKGKTRELKGHHVIGVSRKIIAQINTILMSRKV